MKFDITGKTFGGMTVLSWHSSHRFPSGSVGSKWMCRCFCGREVVMHRSVLGTLPRSCGCMIKHFKHGRSNDITYKSWSSMIARCRNARNNVYHLYGGRGIAVCDRWLDFRNFVADMGTRPTLNHSIDRIDSNGHYCPENCRWADIFQQANNKRTNLVAEYRGKTQTLMQWSKELGLGHQMLRIRFWNGKRGEELFAPSRRKAA